MKNKIDNMFVDYRNIQNVECRSRLWLAIVAVMLSLLMASCVKELAETGGSSVTPDGKVLISLSVGVPVSNPMQTRATEGEENQINSLAIIVLDADNKLSQSPAFATFDGTKWKVALAPNPVLQTIYAIANLSVSQKEDLENVAIGASYDELRELLTYSNVAAEGVSHPFLMFSQMLQTAITPTMGAKHMEMTRAVARIDVYAAITPADFTLESVTLLNAAKKYSPIAIATSPDMLTGEDVVRYNEVSTLNNRVASAIYCYENNTTQTNATQLLIKGKYKEAATSGYYKLNIVYSNAGTSHYDIKRNCIYTVTITAVNNNGYSSENEALLAPPSNGISTEIVVSDADARDIQSNGSFYLGFSNSECIIYTSEEHPNELIATFSHNAPSWAGDVTVQVQGVGLTFNSSSILPVSDGSVKTGSISVNIGNNFVSGNVIVKLGDLEKTIKITRNMEPLSYGGAFNLGDSYIYARKLDVSSQSNWIKLSPDADSSVTEDEIDHPGGSIHMQLEMNLILLGGVNRTCDLICARSNHEGRVRVKVAQYAFDILNKGGQLQSAFAGTFHRWNQVGERIIKMKHQGTTAWVASVVEGRDFIVLAAGASSDPKVGTIQHGDAELYSVLGSKTSIVGTSEDIVFRVGMKSTLPSAESEPRYGLILVTHGGGTHRIFVRQGDAPDYVFGKEDGWKTGVYPENEVRPLAIKWSPYNLTDPLLGKGGTEITTQNKMTVNDLNYNPGKFTQFPSQVGYFFFRNVRNTEFHYAFHPLNSWYGSPDSQQTLSFLISQGNDKNELNINPGAAYLPSFDPCPAGYRYPNDHTAFGAMASGSTKDNSELRQSLAYGLANSTDISLVDNSIYGYYADGFFDRLQIISSKSVSPDGQGADNTMVVNGGLDNILNTTGNDIGMQGLLIFNPFTNRSIFLPSSGKWVVYNQGIRGLGETGNYWTTSWYGNQFGSIWSMKANLAIQYSQGDGSDVMSVRCVRKEP